jgi:hypothetical protein
LARSGRESRRQNAALRFRASFLLSSKHGYFNLKFKTDGLFYSELDRKVTDGIIRGTTVVFEYVFFIVAPIGDVVHRSGVFYAKWTGHEGSLSEV